MISDFVVCFTPRLTNKKLNAVMCIIHLNKGMVEELERVQACRRAFPSMTILVKTSNGA